MPDHYLLPQSLAKKLPRLGELLFRFDAWLLQAGFWLLARLSPRASNQLSAAAFGWLGPRGTQRRKVQRNLQMVFPTMDTAGIERLVKATYRHAGLAAAELAQAAKILAEKDTRLQVVCEDERILSITDGSPAVIVTAHVGAWQYVAMLGCLLGFRFTSVYASEYNPHVRSLFLRLRQQLGCEFISRDNSIKVLMKELAEGRSVGLAIDTRYDRGKLLPFFGADAATNTTAARLALRYGCPLIAVRCDRLPLQRYRIVMARQILPDPDCTDIDEQVIQMTATLNSEFENWIRNSPGQWLCMKRRWPKEIQ